MDVVIGAEDTERHKPEPEPLLEALRRLGAEPADAAYVGDSPFDVRGREGRRACSRSRSAGAGSTPTSGCSREEPGRARPHGRRSCLVSSEQSTRRAVDELRRLVEHHNYRYHVLDDPEIPDSAYDALFDELKAIEEAHPELVTPDSPTQRVGGAPAAGFTKVEHLQPMGSLEKVTTGEALEKWADDVRKRLGTDEPVAYVIEPKIDGSAISLVYEHGVFVRGATRGDGDAGRGRDRATSARSRRCRSACSSPTARRRRALLEVRGEVYFPLSGFARFNEAQVAAGKKPAPNPRNAAAGSLRQLDPRDHRRAAALALGLRRRRPRGRLPADRSGRCSRGCASTASARTRTPSGSRRSRRSPRRAAAGRRGARSSTTRSTAS